MSNHTSKTVTVLEVGFGNLPSLKRVLSQIKTEVKIARTVNDIVDANHLIIPGVGAFGTAMDFLKLNNFEQALRHRCLDMKLPTLGICLGAQIMLEVGFEGGDKAGLGIFAGTVKSLESSAGIGVTHTGWDKVEFNDNFLGIDKYSAVDTFFNHDFILIPKNTNEIYGTCGYGNGFAVALNKFKTFAVQFHPEKSQLAGLNMLQHFLEIDNV